MYAHLINLLRSHKLAFLGGAVLAKFPWVTLLRKYISGATLTAALFLGCVLFLFMPQKNSKKAKTYGYLINCAALQCGRCDHMPLFPV
jgi:hypothetical protein